GDSEIVNVNINWNTNASSATIMLVETNVQSGCKDSTFHIVTFVAKPIPVITGTNSSCKNLVQQLSTIFNNAHTYRWSTNAGSVVGSSTNDKFYIYWNTNVSSATVTLVESLALSGCSDSAFKVITINPSPATPVITGSYSPCRNSRQTYSTNSQTNCSYSWGLSGGNIIGSDTSLSVIVDWTAPTSGSISVSAINSVNGCPATTTQIITFSQYPTPVISGKQSAFKGATEIYSVQNNAGSLYKWFVASGTINGTDTLNSVSVTWDTTNSGSLKVIETTNKGCTDSTSLNISLTTGVDEDFTNDKTYFRIFPNPVKDNLQIELSDKFTGNIILKIFDELGITVLRQTISGVSNAKPFYIDTRNFTTGIYFCTVSSRNFCITKKFIVVK
ncbi:MAG: T9SS type A sorting domain-containing protein, partial [Bacteroidota bacterium]